LVIDDTVEWVAGLVEEVSQDVGLLDGAGETIQEETLGGVGLGQTGLDHAGGDIGGHQLAGINVLLGLDAERGALADVGAEQISGGDVRDAELLREDGCLGALAGTGGTKENESHYFRSPS